MLALAIELEILVITTYLAQLILHEFGHLLFGLLTGYRFLFVRVFGLVVFNDNTKLAIRKLGYEASFAQCLMQPPQKENFPFALNILGGILLNGITAIVSLSVLAYNIKDLNLRYILAFGLLTFFGAGFAFVNSIPLIGYSYANDGRIFNEMLKDPLARLCYRKQLTMISMLVDGKSYGEIPYDLFCVGEDADLTNSLIGFHKVLECYHFMDLRDWEKAKYCLSGFYENLEKLPKILRNTVLAEDLFIRINMRDTTVKESRIYKNLWKYLLNGRGNYNTIRVRIAYDYIYNQEKNNKKILEELSRLNKRYLYQGEAKFCQSLIKDLL